ncbi:hypothetical protein ACVNIS_15390 [Sphaerotilaceae bacterium SBD11-9]
MIRGKRGPIVHVVAFRKNSDSPIQVRVTPDILDMTQYAKGPQIIRWRVDTKGFHFPDDGTAIEFTSPGWQESFGKVQVECEGRLASVHNKNRDALAFAYNVRLIEKATGLMTVLDPTIQNNWP